MVIYSIVYLIRINPVRNSRAVLRIPRELSQAVTHVHPVRNMVSNGAQERRVISNGIYSEKAF